MIANLPTVSRTNLLHVCLTLTYSTNIYIYNFFLEYWLKKKLSCYLRSIFSCFPLFLISQASDLWQIMVLWGFFLGLLQNVCCSFWCLQLKRFYPATNRSPGRSPSPLFSDLPRFVLTPLMLWFICLWAWCSGFAACLNCIAVPLPFVSLGAKQLQKSALKRVIKCVVNQHYTLSCQAVISWPLTYFPS